MSNKVRIAFAVLAGYCLGRRRKLRLAMALAAAGLAGRARGGEGGLLAQGIKALGSSPELTRITDRLRGDLMEVGKAAAVAATSRQIDSLSGKLQDRAEALRTPGGVKEAGEAAKRAAGKRPAKDEDIEDEAVEEDDYDEEEDAEEEEPEESEEPEEPDESDESDEDVEDRAEEEPVEKKPARRRPVRRGSTSRR